MIWTMSLSQMSRQNKIYTATATCKDDFHFDANGCCGSNVAKTFIKFFKP